jgi:hypothetical protein
MGIRNYLVEGVSGTGKTSVCDELQRRGVQAVHGDRELAYQGGGHAHHIWDVGKVEALIRDKAHAMSFFCGGSRNFHRFIHLFDGVFVLDVDAGTLERRLAARPEDEFGGRASEREFVLRLHATKEDVPKDGVVIDATAPVARVVDEILKRCG